MNKTTFEDFISENGSLTYTNVGTSMMPLLRQGKDLFTITKKGRKRCKKGDVVLYRKSGKYVLHRIIKVRKNDYVILGDNCISKEYCIKDRDIIGIMTSFVRSGREYSVNDLSYQIYSKIILTFTEPRIFLKKKYLSLKRRVKKIIYEK